MYSWQGGIGAKAGEKVHGCLLKGAVYRVQSCVPAMEAEALKHGRFSAGAECEEKSICM
jgi:hypothetical protein